MNIAHQYSEQVSSKKAKKFIMKKITTRKVGQLQKSNNKMEDIEGREGHKSEKSQKWRQ